MGKNGRAMENDVIYKSICGIEKPTTNIELVCPKQNQIISCTRDSVTMAS